MRRPPTTESALTLVVMLGLLVALGSNAPPEIAASAATAAAISPTLAQANKSTRTPAPVKLLKVEPVKGYVGDSFTVTGDGFTPGSRKWISFGALSMAPTQLKLYLTTSSTMSASMKRNASAWVAAFVDRQGRVNTVLYRAGGFRRSARHLRCRGRTGRGPRRLPHPAQRYHHSHRRPRGNANHHHGEGVELARIRTLYGAALRQQVHR